MSGNRTAVSEKAPRESRRMKLLKRTGLFGQAPAGLEIGRAETLEDLQEAYRLVHDAFVEQGYIQPHPSGLRIRPFEAMSETATFVAKVDGSVVGVQSLVVDNDGLGLPSDESFQAELDALRQDGRRVCEATNEAIAPEFRRTSVPTELMRCCFAQALAIGCNDLITTVSPGHAKFYGLLGFEQVSPVRSYSKEVDDPVVVVRLDLDTIAPRAIVADAGIREDDAFFKSYYLDDNPYHRRVEGWSIAGDDLFSDPVFLKELFVTKSGLLVQCSEQELEAIRHAWGDEAFAEVWGAQEKAEFAGKPEWRSPAPAQTVQPALTVQT